MVLPGSNHKSRGNGLPSDGTISTSPGGSVSHPGWSHKSTCNGRATAAAPGGRTMFSDIFQELSGRGVSVLLGLVIGGSVTWLFARWRRFRQRQSVLCGDARDTVVLNFHLVESAEG